MRAACAYLMLAPSFFLAEFLNHCPRDVRMRIHDMPATLRPRERAQKEGIRSLSDAEVVAILIRFGVRGKSALALSEEWLARAHGSLEELYTLTDPSRSRESRVASLSIHAGLELGRRLHARESIPISLEEALTSVREKLSLEKMEMFFVIALDLRDQCTAPPACVAVGSRYSVSVDVKAVVHAAVVRNAARIVVVHNHPSQDVSPSSQDVMLTKQLMEACAWLEIQFKDHVIVSKRAVFSFREEGMLN